jgi:rhodanese-related sulfurtransferase
MNDSISAADLGKLLSAGKKPHLVDVRTPAEFTECHVRGAKLAPLDGLDVRKIGELLKPTESEPIYLLCKSGNRAGRAAEQFRAAGIPAVTVVSGGTEGCVAAGVPVERGTKATMHMDGQVRVGLGVFLLLLWVLARYVHYGFAYLIPLLGIALIVSGFTGFCGLAILLGKAPWNRSKEAEGARIGCGRGGSEVRGNRPSRTYRA